MVADPVASVVATLIPEVNFAFAIGALVIKSVTVTVTVPGGVTVWGFTVIVVESA